VAGPNTRVDAPDHGVPPAVRTEIIVAYEARLGATGNPIYADPHALRQALRQAEAVIDEVARHRQDGMDGAGSKLVTVSLAVGADRAQHGVHPSHSLRAATDLFEVALPPLLEHYTGPAVVPRSTPDQVAIALQGAIMTRVTVGSLSYVGFLLDRVYTSHLEERRRIARDLHDRVAHAVGVGIQHLDLHRIYQERGADGDRDRAAGQLRRVDQSLRDAVEITRGLSEELRLSVGPQGLGNAVRGYLDANVPPAVAVAFTVQGDSEGMPTVIVEEIYVVVQEAVRNAVLHSGADRLEVTLRIGEAAIVATVTDHGRGFERSPEDFHGGGMLSMRERVELIGGTLSISENPAGGTTVEVRAPLPDNLT